MYESCVYIKGCWTCVGTRCHFCMGQLCSVRTIAFMRLVTSIVIHSHLSSPGDFADFKTSRLWCWAIWCTCPPSTSWHWWLREMARGNSRLPLANATFQSSWKKSIQLDNSLRKPWPEPRGILGYANDKTWAKPPESGQEFCEWKKMGKKSKAQKEIIGYECNQPDLPSQRNKLLRIQHLWLPKIQHFTDMGGMFCCIAWLWITISQFWFGICSGTGEIPKD